MIEFRDALTAKLLDVAQSVTGQDSGATNPVVSFDDHLYSKDISELPFIVVNVRSWDEPEDGVEIGNPHGLKIWTVHIYYLDMTETWNEGAARRNVNVAALKKALDRNKRLDGLETIDDDGTREYVYDSKFTSATFDTSGQEGEYSFVTELYLNVYTAAGL